MNIQPHTDAPADIGAHLSLTERGARRRVRDDAAEPVVLVARAMRPRPRLGQAREVVGTHFTEILQGKFELEKNVPIRGLVTLRCNALRSAASVRVTIGDPRIVVWPRHCKLAAQACRNTLRYLGEHGTGARIALRSNIEKGIGAGSSTADVVATIKATAAALSHVLPPGVVAHLTVDTESASDPIMYPDTQECLFAHRSGTEIERFSGKLPALDVVGIVDGTPVETLSHKPADYSRQQISEFEGLRVRLRAAITSGNVGEVGAIALRSAEINQEFLLKPRFELWKRLARASGAVGISVSHSGSAVGFLFDAADPLREARILALEELLRRERTPVTVRFQSGRSE